MHKATIIEALHVHPITNKELSFCNMYVTNYAYYKCMMILSNKWVLLTTTWCLQPPFLRQPFLRTWEQEKFEVQVVWNRCYNTQCDKRYLFYHHLLRVGAVILIYTGDILLMDHPLQPGGALFFIFFTTHPSSRESFSANGPLSPTFPLEVAPARGKTPTFLTKIKTEVLGH